jgi:hypothetical protein
MNTPPNAVASMLAEEQNGVGKTAIFQTLDMAVCPGRFPLHSRTPLTFPLARTRPLARLRFMPVVSVSYRTLVEFNTHLEGESRSPFTYYEGIITYCASTTITYCASTIITYFLVLTVYTLA